MLLKYWDKIFHGIVNINFNLHYVISNSVCQLLNRMHYVLFG